LVSKLKFLGKSHLNNDSNVKVPLHLVKLIFNFSHYFWMVFLFVFYLFCSRRFHFLWLNTV
jgi:hypothetical protein